MATVEASLRADALADDVQQRLLIERHGNLRSREARALMIAKLHHNRKWFDSGASAWAHACGHVMRWDCWRANTLCRERQLYQGRLLGAPPF
mmetsp:Transcript_34147/g.101510  ORF Transcript_34147/g.101510 Transcript_34147/m.101510 type:complete len:92 (+) Transcript_34147:384-659(+)